MQHTMRPDVLPTRPTRSPRPRRGRARARVRRRLRGIVAVSAAWTLLAAVGGGVETAGWALLLVGPQLALGLDALRVLRA